jgi:hypothetical protein
VQPDGLAIDLVLSLGVIEDATTLRTYPLAWRTRKRRRASVMSVMSVILLCFQRIKHDPRAAGSVMGSVIDPDPRS